MPSVLIAGCGYVGIAAARLFCENGWDVTGWTRSGAIGAISDRDLPINPRAVDLGNEEGVRINRFQCDVVIHCASSGGGDVADYQSIYRDGAAHLVTCFPGARLLFTSSTSVYAQRDGSWVDGNSLAEPSSAKGRILREAEEIVLSSGGIVLRLAGIYGPGRSLLLQSVLNGSASISDGADRWVNQVHREDIASAIFLLAREEAKTSTRIFNVVDDLPAPRGEILSWLSATLGKPLSNSTEAVGRRRADTNKRVSNRKLRALGWSPRYRDYREGFLRSVLPASGLP
jgi:nucleoside-diphosphate-sugar epimerase